MFFVLLNNISFGRSQGTFLMGTLKPKEHWKLLLVMLWFVSSLFLGEILFLFQGGDSPYLYPGIVFVFQVLSVGFGSSEEVGTSCTCWSKENNFFSSQDWCLTYKRAELVLPVECKRINAYTDVENFPMASDLTDWVKKRERTRECMREKYAINGQYFGGMVRVVNNKITGRRGKDN